MVMSQRVRYAVFNAPWVMISSLCQGLSGYFIILILSSTYGLAAGGEFRLYLSILGMLSIFSLVDTGKIAIKYLVLDDHGVVRPLLRNRMMWALLGVVVGLIVVAVFKKRGEDIWLPLLFGTLLLPLTFSADLFAQINQARRQFRLNAIYSICKHSTLVLVAFASSLVGIAVTYILIGYSAVLTSFHLFYLTRHRETFEPGNPKSRTYVRESVKLSASGVFPIALEHADKLLVSYFFGLEALGLYTIGVSTGRIFVRFVKPVTTIYYPVLVDRLPPLGVTLASLGILTTIGVAFAYPMLYYFSHILGDEFTDGYPMALICLLGLGVHAGGVITYYSSVYYKNSSILIPTITNVVTFLIVGTFLVVAVAAGKEIGLILCAASFPLRDLLNMLIPMLLSKKLRGDEKGEARYENSGSVY